MTVSRLTATALVLLLAGCGDVAGSSDGPASLDGAWELVSGETSSGALEPVPGWPITLTIEGSEIGGRSGCNHYGSRLRGGGFEVGAISSTEMGCSAPVLAAETAYTEALASATSASVVDEVLRITGPDLTLELVPVAPVPTSQLVGTRWVLVSPLPAELEFHDDGTFEGTTGCRAFEGEWQVHGGAVQAPSLDAALPGGGRVTDDCRDQDSQVLGTLGSDVRVEISDGTMTLTAPGGQRLVYRTD